MSKKNSGFAADLAAGIDLTDDGAAPRRSSIASNVLTGRSNRLADLASGRSSIGHTSWWILPNAGCGRAITVITPC
jgi:hypothetical protein